MAKAKKKAAKSTASTALAVRKPKPAQVIIEDPKGLMTPQQPVGQLGELATVGALGLAELKLTDAEEKTLAQPVPIAEILIKPDGTPYLPWASYSRWFSAAFGRLGWSIVPAGKPQKADNLVVMPYLLYVHGRPVAFAWGEQDYHPDNKRQSYGDAIESTQGSALRRCAKRLGVGLELWDKAFLAAWKAEACISVTVSKRGEQKTEWRRKIDPPLPGKHRSTSTARQEDPFGPWPPETVQQRKAAGLPTFSSQLEKSDTITNEQRKRLVQIVERMQRPEADVKLWLKKAYGVTSTAGIQRKDYEAICKVLEGRGALPLPGDGQ